MSIKVRRDAFVKGVRPDPKSTEELVLLQGYIGDSDQQGCIRVYADPTLSDFIDLSEKDVCYADPVSDDEDSLGGSRLWVRKTATFSAGDPGHVNRVKSSFLEGDILKAFGDTGNIPSVVAGGTKFFSAVITCPPTLCTQPPPPNTQVRSCVALCNFTQVCEVAITGAICGGTPVPVTRVVRSCIALCITQKNVTCDFVFSRNRTNCQSIQQTCFLTRQPVRCSLVCEVECANASIRFPTDFRTDVINPTIEQINPAVQQQFGGAAYTGGFNPYQTANFGY
jgi:hypothetical protein